MKDIVNIRIEPAGKTLDVPKGTRLQTCLFEQGVEFPCGGQGRCKGCRIRVKQGMLEALDHEKQLLTESEINDGWRLACCHAAESNLTLEIAQWEAAILSDYGQFQFQPKDGYGIAIDLGTTTVVAQLLSLREGTVLGVRTALNSQAQYGSDIMSRIHYAVEGSGRAILENLIRNQVGLMIKELIESTRIPIEELQEVVVAGNTVMHHLFCGLNVAPLAHYPFESTALGAQSLDMCQLGISSSSAKLSFLPCLGGFVGSDILAGMFATGMSEESDLVCLIDLGTNGEIVLGKRGRFLCASTAAGPAFEGARISMGMRAITGAISRVVNENGRISCIVLGNGKAKGVCGSGLVDAVAVGLDLGMIHASGRINQPYERITLTETVHLLPADVRELQLAKGAITAGIKVLANQWGTGLDRIKTVYLAGAFGNYINRTSAIRIGLLPFALEKIIPSGNTALRGAKKSLFQGDQSAGWQHKLCEITQHIDLGSDHAFQDLFAEEMRFKMHGG